MDVVQTYYSDTSAYSIRVQAGFLRQFGSILSNEDNTGLVAFAETAMEIFKCRKIFFECACWEDGHESLACQKENWDLAWLLYMGSWEYFIAMALFFSINDAQTCSLLGTVMCGAFSLCIAWALTWLTVDVSIMILSQQWQFRENVFQICAYWQTYMNSQLELWITKKIGSDSALELGSKMDLPWERLHGAYVQSWYAEPHREGFSELETTHGMANTLHTGISPLEIFLASLEATLNIWSH